MDPLAGTRPRVRISLSTQHRLPSTSAATSMSSLHGPTGDTMLLVIAQHLLAGDEPTPAQRTELFALFGLAFKTDTILGAIIGGVAGWFAADNLKWNVWVAVILGGLAGMFLWAAMAG